MESQNYVNHHRYVKGYHFILGTLLPLGLVAAVINVYRHIQFEALLSCILILWLFVCALLMGWFLRVFALRAQDRAIRAEESLRHYILTGKAINNQLTMSQIIALRFAPDEEVLELSQKAVAENMSNKDIKQAIKNWKADHHRA